MVWRIRQTVTVQDILLQIYSSHCLSCPFSAVYGIVHDDQLPSGYGRCVMLVVYVSLAIIHDNEQPYAKKKCPLWDPDPSCMTEPSYDVRSRAWFCLIWRPLVASAFILSVVFFLTLKGFTTCGAACSALSAILTRNTCTINVCAIHYPAKVLRPVLWVLSFAGQRQKLACRGHFDKRST